MPREEFWIAALVLVCGCKRAATVRTYPVTGRVTIHQTPLEGATIQFANKNQDSYSASGITDSDGRFKLTTYVNPREVYAGAAPGDYTVLVAKPAPGAVPTREMSQMEHATPEERQAFLLQEMQEFTEQEKRRDSRRKSEVPEKYASMESSTLKATVIIGTNEPFEWDLSE